MLAKLIFLLWSLSDCSSERLWTPSCAFGLVLTQTFLLYVWVTVPNEALSVRFACRLLAVQRERPVAQWARSTQNLRARAMLLMVWRFCSWVNLEISSGQAKLGSKPLLASHQPTNHCCWQYWSHLRCHLLLDVFRGRGLPGLSNGKCIG